MTIRVDTATRSLPRYSSPVDLTPLGHQGKVFTVQEEAFTLSDVDFDAFYQGRPPIAGADVTFEVTPWDIGEAQPVVVALAGSGAVREPVLDAGCGLGNNAILLAERGYQVTGVDGSPTALETARQRAAEHGVQVDFTHADVTSLDGIEQRFNTVLDSALYHCLDGDQRTAYGAALHRVTLPGAQLHLFCFADSGNDGFQMPMAVSQDDLREHLGRHWDIQSITAADYATSLTPQAFAEGGPASQMGVSVDPATIRTDDRDRVLGQVWHLHAERASTT
ncbi:class I SAM-dependent methyltransferase [Herbihabitans rhizosphaerae]|uniref:class I SAM-dependent methyltransferase n=1 Tax=Herbihabitans rhizosphaerae TaxID=1872711 RepID=UPI00102AC8D9|nr:class I SAM-dependent methyltransferase [Herbihabitans rhizosphaerae]